MAENHTKGGRDRVRLYMIGERVAAVAAAAQRGWRHIEVASDPDGAEVLSSQSALLLACRRSFTSSFKGRDRPLFRIWSSGSIGS
jgi:hypothetical protein